MRTYVGDEAMFRLLHRARELYKRRLQENMAVDQLASLFAECAIVEAKLLGFGAESQVTIENDAHSLQSQSQWVMSDAQENSILAETGRMQIVMDAFSDGSIFIH